MLLVLAFLVLFLAQTGDCDCLLKTQEGMVTLQPGSHTDGNTTLEWNLCSNLHEGDCSNSAVCQTGSSGESFSCGTHKNVVAARREAGNSILFQGGDFGCEYSTRSTLFFLHCSVEVLPTMVVELEPCFYVVDLFSPKHCPSPEVVRDIKIGDFCEFIGENIRFKDQTNKFEYDFNFCGGFTKSLKGCKGSYLCVKNRQTITESAVILGREKEMIYAKKRPSNDLAPTYMVLKNGDPCPYNSSIPMSVVVYVGCKKPKAVESFVHVTKNQQVCREIFYYLVEELCPRPRFILSEVPPDFLETSMPKHRVTEYISKDVVREIHEKPRNSLLALSQRTGWEKNEDDDDGVPPPEKKKQIYFHSKGSPGANFYGRLVGARDIAAERKKQHDLKRATTGRKHVPLPHHRFSREENDNK